MNIKRFESFGKDILIVVDVQKSFSKFFTNKYVSEVKKYCQNFDIVYQIYDNHHENDKNTDYLYHEYPELDNLDDLYNLPNVKEVIEKRYNYNVSVDFYKKILSKDVYNRISNLEKSKRIKKGDYFKTSEDTIIVYIGNNHKWFHVPLKLYKILSDNIGKRVCIIGGSNSECLEDVYISGLSLGVNMIKDNNYIYSATNCPI